MAKSRSGPQHGSSRLGQALRLRAESGHRAPAVVYCASVSPNLRCVSANVRQTAASVSDNVRRKWPSIARRAIHYCAPLHVAVARKLAVIMHCMWVSGSEFEIGVEKPKLAAA
jgi:hypothetical protein